MFAVDLDDLLPAGAAFGPGQRRNGLLPANLALRLGAGGRLSLLGGGGRLGGGLADEGAVVTVAPVVPEELAGGFSQRARRLGLLQLVLGVFGPSPQVAVAVNIVKVPGDRVLVVVAVQARLLLRPVGTVDVLRRTECQLSLEKTRKADERLARTPPALSRKTFDL